MISPLPRVDGRDPAVAAFAYAWTQAMEAASYVPMVWEERFEFLASLAGRLDSCLRADRFDAMAGYRVGAEMVMADFAAPEALGRTLALIHTRLLTDLGLSGPQARARLIDVAGAVATGHSRALRDRTLDGQEAVRRAAIEARERAEQALRAAERRLRHAALHDALTGLPNRTLFGERLRQLVASRQDGRGAVCVIGLDGFAAINDSLGPLVGDRLLVAVSARLARFAAEGGHLLARLEGDEFALLIEDTRSPDDAVKAADRALSVLGESFRIDGHDLSVQASAGIKDELTATHDPMEIVRAARISLRFAKADGGSRWMLFDEHRNNAQLARYQLTAAMPAALARGEFTLAYQPLVHLATGRVAGVEALARWRHPIHGIVSPDRFIHLAEDTGLIVTLGSSLLEQACVQAAAWSETTPDPPYVSVNLAARQIRHPGLLADVIGALERTGLPAHRLQLEITESSLFPAGEHALPAIQALADLGVRVAIDDFGTGYANHAHLRLLPIHALKLAAPFTDRLDQSTSDSKDEAILANLIALGHLLNLTVTAEGIETSVQAQRLRALGCDLGQGWHLGRPASSHDVRRLLGEPCPS